MESSENVPRFLDDVEMIERKTLRVDSLGKQRWSLSERRQDTQSLAEMGVAVLDDCQNPAETTTSTDMRENLENRSPNLRSPHSLKRPHAKSSSVNVSPMSVKVSSPGRIHFKKTDTTQFEGGSKHNNFKNNTTKTSSEHVNPTAKDDPLTNSSRKVNTMDKYLQFGEGPSCGASMPWNSAASFRLDESEDRVENSEDSSLGLDCAGHNFDNIDRLWLDSKSASKDGEGFPPKRNKTLENNSGITADVSSSSQSDVSLTSVSPRPTCSAHPALHNRPSFTSIPRHTTFDYDTSNEDGFGDPHKLSVSNEGRIASEQIDSNKSSKMQKESAIMNTSELTSVDRVIFDSTISDLDHTIAANGSDERSYFKPDDTELEIATDRKSSEQPSPKINLTLKNTSIKTGETVNKISSNKKDSRKRNASEKQSSLKAYFFVENEKNIKKPRIDNNASSMTNEKCDIILSTGNTDSNLEHISNVVSDVKNVAVDVQPSPEIKCDSLSNEGDVCHNTPVKNIQNDVSFSNVSVGSCEACGDKGKCCDSHSKAPAVSEEDGGMFAKLSDEVVLSILQWLPKRTIVRCMLVSRRWRRLGADSRLWARVDLGGRVLPSGSLTTLMERHPVALRLANAQLTSPVIPPPSIQRVEILKWRIQYLDLSAASVSTACLAAILEASPGLVRLSLEGLTLGQHSANALIRLMKLKSLNLALTLGIGPAVLQKYDRDGRTVLWPQCESLNAAWCNLEPEELNALCECLPPALQRYNVSGYRKGMTDAMAAKIVERCPSLVELDLSDSAQLTGEAVHDIIRLPLLEHLALSRCYKLLRQDYVKLIGCQSLQWLDTFGLHPNLSMPILQKSLPNIHFNRFIHSSIARPTVGNRRTSIWGLRTRD